MDMSDGQQAEVIANAEKVLSYIKVSLIVLSLRATVMGAMLLGFAVTIWALAAPDALRTAVAIAWWPLVYLPALWAERTAR